MLAHGGCRAASRSVLTGSPAAGYVAHRLQGTSVDEQLPEGWTLTGKGWALPAAAGTPVHPDELQPCNSGEGCATALVRTDQGESTAFTRGPAIAPTFSTTRLVSTTATEPSSGRHPAHAT